MWGELPVLRYFFDGSSAVFVFIMLSGFSICCAINKKTDDIQKVLASIVLKRYFRLALPIVLPTIMAYILYKSRCMYYLQVSVETSNQWLSTLMPEHISIANLASSVIFGPIRSALIAPLWMMHYIFFGTFIIIPIGICARKINRELWKYGFLVMMACVMLRYDIYYFSVVLGVILFFYLQDGYHKFWLGRYLAFISMVLLITVLCIEGKFVNVIRAIALVIMIVHTPFFQRILGSKLLQSLNRISYQIYLLHIPIICSWSCFFYILFGSSMLMMLINLATTLMFTFLIAILFTRIDEHIGKRLNEICDNMLR